MGTKNRRGGRRRDRPPPLRPGTALRIFRRQSNATVSENVVVSPKSLNLHDIHKSALPLMFTGTRGIHVPKPAAGAAKLPRRIKSEECDLSARALRPRHSPLHSSPHSVQ